MSSFFLSIITDRWTKENESLLCQLLEQVPLPCTLFAPWEHKPLLFLPEFVTPGLWVSYGDIKKPKDSLKRACQQFVKAFCSKPPIHHSHNYRLSRQMVRALQEEKIFLDHSVYHPVSPIQPCHNRIGKIWNVYLLPKSYGYTVAAFLPPLLPFTHGRKKPLFPFFVSLLPFYFTKKGFLKACKMFFEKSEVIAFDLYLPLLAALPEALQKTALGRLSFLLELKGKWLRPKELPETPYDKLTDFVPVFFKGVDYNMVFKIYRILKSLPSIDPWAYG